ERVRVEERNAVVAVVGHDDGSPGGDVADRATTDRDDPNGGDIRIHMHLVIHIRISSALRHHKVSHIHSVPPPVWSAPALDSRSICAYSARSRSSLATEIRVTGARIRGSPGIGPNLSDSA